MSRSDDPDLKTWQFDWGDIRGEMSSLGGMLGPVSFLFPDGREVQPFAMADRPNIPRHEVELSPPVQRRIRGEWPCVPFGAPRLVDGTSAEHAAAKQPWVQDIDDFMHGFAANHHWTLVTSGADYIEIGIDYPPDHPVEFLRRRIERESQHTLTFSLAIGMRNSTDFPIGLHPVFVLPEVKGGATLDLPFSRRARRMLPRSSAVSGGIGHHGSNACVVRSGKTDVYQICPRVQSEDNLAEPLSLFETGSGAATLRNHIAGYTVELTWDADLFTHCLIWLPKSASSDLVWSGGTAAVGIEPIGWISNGRAVGLQSEPRINHERTNRTTHSLNSISTAYQLSVSESGMPRMSVYGR